MSNNIKNEYVKKVGNVKRRLNRYDKTVTRTKDVYDKETGKVIGTQDIKVKLKSNLSKSFGNVLQNAYDDYKAKVKEYNKGEISLEQVAFADEKLSQVLSDIEKSFNRKTKQGVTTSYYDEDMVDYLERVSGASKQQREQALQNSDYDDLKDYDIYNAVAEILNRANEKAYGTEGTYTSDDIYDMLYSNAIESANYEEIVESLAEDKVYMRESIITPYKERGALSDEDELLIMNLLGI